MWSPWASLFQGASVLHDSEVADQSESRAVPSARAGLGGGVGRGWRAQADWGLMWSGARLTRTAQSRRVEAWIPKDP